LKSKLASFDRWPSDFSGCFDSFRVGKATPLHKMEDVRYFAGLHNAVLLCIAVGLAVTFLVILAFDSHRRKRNHHRQMGRHARGSSLNLVDRWYRRTRHFIRSMKEVYYYQKRTKAMRERSRSR
jgi:hypothetical protein